MTVGIALKTVCVSCVDDIPVTQYAAGRLRSLWVKPKLNETPCGISGFVHLGLLPLGPTPSAPCTAASLDCIQTMPTTWQLPLLGTVRIGRLAVQTSCPSDCSNAYTRFTVATVKTEA